MLAFGWKKKDVYTIIEYLDGFNQKQVLVFDFGEHIQEAQQMIYDRMLASHFARDKLLEGAALEDNATKTQKSVGSHVSELPEINYPRHNDNDNDDPLHILKIRFAKGEISKEEYEKMRKMLE
jgi:hypothetical protein